MITVQSFINNVELDIYIFVYVDALHHHSQINWQNKCQRSGSNNSIRMGWKTLGIINMIRKARMNLWNKKYKVVLRGKINSEHICAIIKNAEIYHSTSPITGCDSRKYPSQLVYTCIHGSDRQSTTEWID